LELFYDFNSDFYYYYGQAFFIYLGEVFNFSFLKHSCGPFHFKPHMKIKVKDQTNIDGILYKTICDSGTIKLEPL
jgi:hypothetical protein